MPDSCDFQAPNFDLPISNKQRQAPSIESIGSIDRFSALMVGLDLLLSFDFWGSVPSPTASDSITYDDDDDWLISYLLDRIDCTRAPTKAQND
jgi:hypothetical protein